MQKETIIQGMLMCLSYLGHLWGDLLRSVPFIMGGHLNMDFFQVVFAQVFDTNP